MFQEKKIHNKKVHSKKYIIAKNSVVTEDDMLIVVKRIEVKTEPLERKIKQTGMHIL